MKRVLVACAAGSAYGAWRMANFVSVRHTLPRILPDAGWPTTVSAVVPARDEADRIQSCVRALLRTGPPLVEVLVVDDHSSDDTSELAAVVRGVRVLAAPPLGAGTLGKPAACAAGAAAATGEWLWFVDADVTVEPDLLARLLAHADDTGAAMVSALGRFADAGPVTGWLLPELGFALARRIDLDDGRFASGQCLLVQREAYERLGGHAAVVHEVAEDLALARRAAHLGVASQVALAPDGFAVAMYDDAASMWHGLAKNAIDVRGDDTRSLVRELGWAATGLVPLLLAPRSKLARWTVAAQVALSAGARWRSRAPMLPAVLAPLAEPVLVTHWLLARRRPSFRWKGREVSASGAARRG